MDWDVFFVFLGIAFLVATIAAGFAAFYALDDGDNKFGGVLVVVTVILALGTCLSFAAADTPERHGCEDHYGESVPC